jgi:hypothetical protein
VALEATLEGGHVREVVDLYRGDLLAGVHVRETPAFEQWLDGERGRLRRRAFEAAWALAAVEEDAGNGAGAAHWAHWAAKLLPDDESSATSHRAPRPAWRSAGSDSSLRYLCPAARHRVSGGPVVGNARPNQGRAAAVAAAARESCRDTTGGR